MIEAASFVALGAGTAIFAAVHFARSAAAKQARSDASPVHEDRPSFDSPEHRARRVAKLTAERELFETDVAAGHERRIERDQQRRRLLTLERVRYRLTGRSARHVDDMVA